MAEVEDLLSPTTDLSEGTLGDLRSRVENGILQEEIDRRAWKNRFLLGGSIIVVAFYCLLVGLIVCAKHTDWHVLVIVSIIPTATAFSLLRLVAKPVNESRDDEREIPSPWAKLAKELAELFKELKGALKSD